MRYLASVLVVLAAATFNQAGSFGPFALCNFPGLGDQLAKYGFVPGTGSLTPEQRLDSWFRHYLGRAPTATERSRGAALWRKGATSNSVKGSILGMREYYLKKGGTPVGFSKGLYLDVMGRPPTVAEAQEIVTALANGTSRAKVARGLLSRRAGVSVFSWLFSQP
jgi:hypothetical protein